MIIFKYGFEYKNMLYGWHKKRLYRLPLVSKNRNYRLKKLPIIDVGNNKGYRVGRDKKTVVQVYDMTNVIPKVIINKIKHEDLPF